MPNRDNAKRHVTCVTLKGTEKRYKPSRHYVYILEIRWSDGSKFAVYRKYSRFYDFHTTLLDMFPIEGGLLDPKERIIPYLPGKKLFQRSEVQRVATKRQAGLAEYCQSLIQLDAKISQSPHVLQFFEAKPADINPPKDASIKPRKSSLLTALLPFKPGKGLKSVKGEDMSGSSDAIYISGPIPSESYRAIADYKATQKTEVHLHAGNVVDVIEKHDNGWWFVQTDDSQGWAPASYLEPINEPLESEEPEPLYAGEKFMTTEAHKAALSDEVSFEAGVIVEVLHKLLDGWWIISYNGAVGYAPALFLMPYSNPHIQPTVRKKKTSFKPTPRRCTIKNTNSIWRSRPKRDLSIYRASLKRRPSNTSCPSFIAPTPPDDETYKNQTMEEIYENDADVVGVDEDDCCDDGSENGDYINMQEEEEEEEDDMYEDIQVDDQPSATPHGGYMGLQEQQDIYYNDDDTWEVYQNIPGSGTMRRSPTGDVVSPEPLPVVPAHNDEVTLQTLPPNPPGKPPRLSNQKQSDGIKLPVNQIHAKSSKEMGSIADNACCDSKETSLLPKHKTLPVLPNKVAQKKPLTLTATGNLSSKSENTIGKVGRKLPGMNSSHTSNLKPAIPSKPALSPKPKPRFKIPDSEQNGDSSKTLPRKDIKPKGGLASRIAQFENS